MAAYVKPGVYSKYVRTAGSVKISAGTRVVAIIGAGLTYFTETDEGIVRGAYPYGSTADGLAYTASEIISVGDNAGGNNYTENVDYQLLNGQVDWSLGADAPDAGATYYVTYKHDKVSTDYNAQLFTKIKDIENEYGKESITNTLTLGAKLAFQNGANYIIGVQIAGTTTQDWYDAIDKLQYRVSGVDATIIVPLNTSSAVQAYLKTHIETMSSQYQKKERYGIIGMPIGTSFADIKAKALAYAYNRIILPYDEPVREIKDPVTYVTSDVSLDGTFLGAAIAGMMTKFVVQEPLTRKTIVGFKSVVKTDALLETEKNELAGSGVLLLEESGGVISIRHGMTTDVSTVQDNEISVMLIRDNTIKGTRDALDRVYIAKVSTNETEANIKTDIESILGQFIRDGSLLSFSDVTVSRNSTDATRYDVSFTIEPAYPINTIFIEFTI